MARDPITVTQLLAALRGRVEILEQRGDVSRPVHAITDDSRAVTGGSLFVAVKGERVDGHGFVGQAIKAGAVAVIAQAPCANQPPARTVTALMPQAPAQPPQPLRP